MPITGLINLFGPFGVSFPPKISHTALGNFRGFLPFLGSSSCGAGPIYRRWTASRAPPPACGVRGCYRCSLGTNTVLGLVTNGLLAVLADGGAEN